MSDSSLTYKIEVDVSDATAALNALAESAERAVEALKKLSDIEHGGLSLKMVGSTMVCNVRPPIAQ